VTRFFPAVVLAAVLGTGPLVAAESPVGKWNTVDEKTGKVVSEVEVYEQSEKIFGKITALAEPRKENGEPKTCTKCPGTDKDKPIVGLVIIRDLSPAGSSYNGGTIIDPDDGKVYKAEVWVEDGKLKVRGYIGFFYRTQTWLKGA